MIELLIVGGLGLGAYTLWQNWATSDEPAVPPTDSYRTVRLVSELLREMRQSGFQQEADQIANIMGPICLKMDEE